MSSLESQRERGERARQILDNPLFQEAIDDIYASYREAWENTTLSQTQEREEIFRMIKNLERVASNLIEVLQTGKFAKDQLKETESV